MKIIKGYYPTYYRDADLNEAVILWHKVLADEDFGFIQKGLEQYIKTDSRGFPPTAGQLITLAKEIRRAEWEERKRQTDLLPEPEIQKIPMPDDVKEKIQNLFRCPF